jgi:hypothetical protein
MPKRPRGWLSLLLSTLFCCLLTSPTSAENLISPHYKFSESALGQNGLQDSSSANFQGTSSTGDLGVGESGSLHYGFQGGSVTTNAPRLAVAVTSSTVNFPTFTPGQESMATATFQVLNYTSYGYTVFVAGDSPKNVSANHTIPGMTDDTTTVNAASTPGFEQFGLNLVANATPTAPQNIGANPDNGTYGWAYGNYTAQYGNNGRYKYVDGDSIASATKSGGYTNYTITYLINVARLTPAGSYTSNQQLIVVGTY